AAANLFSFVRKVTQKMMGVTLNCWKNGEKKRRIGKKEYNYLLKVRAFFDNNQLSTSADP
ncbi:unnamed protein product, partial [marine sediment metagenome]